MKSDHDPAVSPEQEARLRRLLAQARHAEPIPTDVAARLDRVLEQLEAEEPDPHAGRNPVDLAARRRRRVRTLLVAAAAVVVVGIGIGQVVPIGQSSDDAASTSDSAGSSAESFADNRSADSDTTSGLDDSSGYSQAAPEGAETEVGPLGSNPRPPVRLTSEGFAKEAVRLRERPGVRATAGAVVPAEALSGAEDFVCETADWGPGKLLAALYDAVPTVLAYRPVAGATQTVDLLRCGTGEVLRSTVLPVER